MPKALEILEEAMTLPRAERSFVADRLLESLDGEAGLSPAWSAEIARRIARRESGESSAYSREDIRKDVQALLSK
ncbi:addiction module protein [Luteolibacter sp. Populi]|uniref:addiction module protein n=1 Tax=Luteolibacter sp. Populi TaxID=3230487 RepID=UPI00346789DE